MTIQEILEAHQLNSRHLLCACGDDVSPVDGADWLMGEVYSLHRAHLAEVMDKHMQEREAQLRQLVRDMTDPGACWFDHRGGCQEHGYLDLKPGELCPHDEAKQLLGDEPNGR